MVQFLIGHIRFPEHLTKKVSEICRCQKIVGLTVFIFGTIYLRLKSVFEVFIRLGFGIGQVLLPDWMTMPV